LHNAGVNRVPALLAAATTLAVVLPAHATSRSATSGLRGLVKRSPTQPVCRAETPCSAPAPGVVITFVRRGVSHSVKTDARGRYRIALGAGRYAVRIPRARFGYAPHVATVAAGRFVVANFEIDTGIR